MTPEQQRIAIAEACGAKWYQWAGEYWITFKDWNMKRHCYEADRPAETSSHPKIEVSVPDYLNDLNAMHDAERILSPTSEIEWHNQLQNVCGCSWRVMIRATAAQRAEAFLRTLGRWEEES